MFAHLAVLVAGIGLAVAGHVASAETLSLERKIPLGDVGGRIDHMALDPATGRLFVAELGNNSVGIIDMSAGSVMHRIGGLSEPQGVGYVPDRNLLVVANGGTGEVVAYNTSDFSPAWRVSLGSDADNVRVDVAASDLFVGYGSALATLDLDGRKKRVAPLAGHSEAFQLMPDRVIVNVPSARQIAVVDRRSGRVKNWTIPGGKANFPMAVDAEIGQAMVVFRDPPRLAVFDVQAGKELAAVPSCGDADDIWSDRKRNRVYVSCGDGHVSVLSRAGESLREVERVPTIEGARTSLFVPESDLLLVAARARGSDKPAIWVFRARD
jgi:DNA-binding beta-propeller fold protein YncE